MKRLLGDVLWRGAGVVLAGAVAALAGGIEWALATALLLLMMMFLRHLIQLHRLLRWLAAPASLPLPEAEGAWGDVFAHLHRHTRQSAEERRQLELAMERFRRAGQALPEGVVMLDAQRCIEWLNACAEGQLGLNPRQDVGSPVVNLLREPEFISYLEAGRYERPLILRPVRTPGRTLELQVVRYGEAQLLLLSRDISQLDRLETMRRDFVANVSHELKTPLTVVGGFIETLQDGLPQMEDGEARQYLDLAAGQAQRMQHLIEDLLALSQLETGRPPPLAEQVPLAGLIDELVGEARALSAGAHEIHREALPDGLVLLGSRSELHSALANLLSNAVRYTPAGGTIQVSWSDLPEGGGRLSVTDSGIGIASQHIPRLSERFYRVDRGRSTATGGTGLGLAIVKHILERHDATLEITSQPGRGSTFSARFPAARVSLLAVDQPSEPS
jgi:two-component system phosphate regulon sensor histidine kinase PhoR